MLSALLTTAVALTPGALASNSDSRVLSTRFTYTAKVGAPSAGKPLRLWLPIPSSDELQKISGLTVTSPAGYRITKEAGYGNRMIYVEVPKAAGPIEVEVSFDVERKTAGLVPLHNLRNLQQAIQPDHLVPVGGRYSDMAKEVVGAWHTPYQRARSLYEHVVASMQYDYKKESPKLGDGDVAFVCDYKKGNCSDLHSYLISLGRSLGVPMVLEYGFPISGIPVPDKIAPTGKITGYHCWTWFYDPVTGWLPLDASDARRWLDAARPDVKQRLFGQLVLERSAVAFSRGRDLILNPPQKQPPLNNFIYPYAESSGDPVEVKWDLVYALRGGTGG